MTIFDMLNAKVIEGLNLAAETLLPAMYELGQDEDLKLVISLKITKEEETYCIDGSSATTKTTKNKYGIELVQIPANNDNEGENENE